MPTAQNFELWKSWKNFTYFFYNYAFLLSKIVFREKNCIIRKIDYILQIKSKKYKVCEIFSGIQRLEILG